MTTQPDVGLADPGIDPSPTLVPFIKWPGGKSDELGSIAAAAPVLRGRLIDSFVGGGSVLLATPAEVPAWANDACEDLARLYALAVDVDRDTRDAFGAMASAWDALRDQKELYAELAVAFRRHAERDAVLAIVSTRAASLRRLVRAVGPGLVDPFFERLERDLPTKFQRMARIQASVGRLSTGDLAANVEGAVRAAFYMAARHRYNGARTNERWDIARSVDFLFLREFAYAAMFRSNSRDEFNVPFGGITYNRKSLTTKIASMFGDAMRARLAATTWRSGDFEAFLAEADPIRDDFVFVDPPYDSDFSAYDNLEFGWRDQLRLQEVLETLEANVMVVIKDTPMIRELYGSNRWSMTRSAKTYMWTIKSRNDRTATHLTITNY